jgi:hypothetical protein
LYSAAFPTKVEKAASFNGMMLICRIAEDIKPQTVAQKDPKSL